MSQHNTLWTVQLGPQHKPTGRTVHRLGTTELPAPSSLAITTYPGDQGYYLIYLDATGEELTDTLHDSPDAAMEQAEWEFGVRASEWNHVHSP